jgi:hypothetical protein
VREDGGDCEAAGALDVHEEGSWTWDESLHPLNQRLVISLRWNSRTLSLCLRASACGVGLRRSTARTYGMIVSMVLVLISVLPKSVRCLRGWKALVDAAMFGRVLSD